MKNDFEFLIYNTRNDDISVNAVIEEESIWLAQKAMKELFSVKIPAISKHLKNIFIKGELEEEVVVFKDKFNKTQMIVFDSDKEVEKLLKKGGEKS